MDSVVTEWKGGMTKKAASEGRFLSHCQVWFHDERIQPGDYQMFGCSALPNCLNSHGGWGLS